MKIQVFDPPMCCSTGVCGPSIDPVLVRFAADLEWLQEQGVEVQRFNLSQQPAAFADTPSVKEMLTQEGNDCLPLTMADGKTVCKGRYPNREMLAGFAHVAWLSQTEQVKAAPCCCGSSPRRGFTGPNKKGSGCC